MRRIRKGAEPATLRPHADDPGATWERVRGDERQALREALFAEQHGLCAYCLSRLNDPKLRPDPAPSRGGMKIEHFDARKEAGITEAESHRRCFDWSNLLGVCPGGEDAPPDKRIEGLYCENVRGNTPLRFNPATFPPDVQTLLRSTDRGELLPAPELGPKQSAPVIAQVETLKLNVGWLRENRRQAIAAARKRLIEQGFKRGAVEALLRRASTPDARGLLPDQCVWVEQYLTKKLRQLPPK